MQYLQHLHEFSPVTIIVAVVALILTFDTSLVRFVTRFVIQMIQIMMIMFSLFVTVCIGSLIVISMINSMDYLMASGEFVWTCFADPLKMKILHGLGDGEMAILIYIIIIGLITMMVMYIMGLLVTLLFFITVVMTGSLFILYDKFKTFILTIPSLHISTIEHNN
jgi:hypothetical protein